MAADMEEYAKLKEAVALVEESKRIEQELDREGLSPSESEALLDRMRALRKATVAFKADPDRKKLLADVEVHFERELAKVTQRHTEALQSLANNAERIAKDPKNGYNAKAFVNKGTMRRQTHRRNRRSRKSSRTTRR